MEPVDPRVEWWARVFVGVLALAMLAGYAAAFVRVWGRL